MKWISVNTRKPKLGQEVLVFCQGCDISGDYKWFSYELGTYIKLPYDKRKREFVQGISIQKEQDGSMFGCPWVYKYVTHWMPLPDRPAML